MVCQCFDVKFVLPQATITGILRKLRSVPSGDGGDEQQPQVLQSSCTAATFQLLWIVGQVQ